MVITRCSKKRRCVSCVLNRTINIKYSNFSHRIAFLNNLFIRETTRRVHEPLHCLLKILTKNSRKSIYYNRENKQCSSNTKCCPTFSIHLIVLLCFLCIILYDLTGKLFQKYLGLVKSQFFWKIKIILV